MPEASAGWPKKKDASSDMSALGLQWEVEPWERPDRNAEQVVRKHECVCVCVCARARV